MTLKYKAPDGVYRTLTTDVLRQMALDACHAMPGYAELTPPQKNVVYNRTRSEIVRRIASSGVNQ